MRALGILLILIAVILIAWPTLERAFPPLVEVAQHVHQTIAPTPTPLPPPDVQQLATQATMTQQAKNLFFGANPTIDTDRQLFNQHCQTPVSTNTIELGCYTPDNHIYLLNISDPRLHTEMVVTAAHEMLHVAYAKLSSSQQQKIDEELESELPELQTPQLARQLYAYQQTEPGARDNELHSIIGTEFPNLHSSLETYYSQYFMNRSQIVSDAQAFNNIFTDLQNQITDLRAQIEDTRRQMQVDRRFGDISDYNSLVPTINNLVDQYNADVKQYNQLSLSLMGQESPEATQ